MPMPTRFRGGRRIDVPVHLLGKVGDLPADCELKRRGKDGWAIEVGGGRLGVEPAVRDRVRLDELLQAGGALVQLERRRKQYAVVGRVFPSVASLPPRRVELSVEVIQELPSSARANPEWWIRRNFELPGGRWAAWAGGHGAIELDRGFDLVGVDRRLTLVPSGPGTLVARELKRVRRAVPGATLLGAEMDFVPFYEPRPGDGPDPSERDEGFVQVWAAYQALERDLVAGLAEAFGEVAYTRRRFDASAGVFVFDLKHAWEQRDPRWSGSSVELVGGSDKGSGERLGEIVAVGPKSLRIRSLDELDEPPPTGQLAISTLGDTKRLQRRARAIERVRDHSAARPELLELLDGRPLRTPPRPRRKVDSPGLRAMLKGRRLTPAQRQAIDAALNGGDVVVIQGPPGTGKTTVIQAIALRLEEEGEGRILLTSFQHDAVLQMIEGSRIGGIAVPTTAGKDPAARMASLQDWLDDYLEAHKEAVASAPQDPREPVAVAASDALLTLPDPPAPASALEAVQAVLAVAEGVAPKAQVESLSRLERSLWTATRRPGRRPRWHDRLDAQLDDPEGFAVDGGAARARDLLRALPRGVPERPVVHAASELLPGQEPPPDWTAALATLRDRAASEARSGGALASDARAKLQQLLGWATEGQVHGPAAHRYAVRLFLEEVRKDPASALRHLVSLAPVISATVHGAERLAKRRGEFDTVIVDEAARANPLDLLIALVLGKRLILVGDDRQLPHILEMELLRLMEESQADTAERERIRALLQESLFGRVVRLYEHSPPDGVRRVFLLDTQFRSAPPIARFVSDEFYGGRLSTPDDFDVTNDTGLYDGRTMVWKAETGRREEGCYHRRAEVQRVAEEVDAALAAGVTDLGIITFYREQAERLLAEARNRGWPDSIRVGSVDAFQGREFDVVFLSCVRSNPRAAVGFLALENRICVAMSRARKVLVVVGDPRTTDSVGSLRRFREAAS